MVTASKAKKILKDGKIRGKPLSKKQQGLFRLMAGGNKPNQLLALKRKLK